MAAHTEVELGPVLPSKEGAPSRWRLRRPAVAAVALLLFAGIYVLRVLDDNAADATLVLCVVPIALCAIEFGAPGGLAAGMLALGLVFVRDISDDIVVGPLGYVSRGTAFLLLGCMLGTYVSKRRALEQTITHYRDASLDLIVTAGFDGYFKQVNPAWQQALGHTEAELLSRPFIEFLHPDDRERAQAEAANLATVGADTISFINRYRTSHGSYRWLEWNARSIPEKGLIYAIARDITARKEAEEAASEARQAAERANQAKSEFLSRMSHELRTPLNSIIGFAQLLEMDDLDEKQRGNTRRILAAGRHLLELINEVLDISRIEAGEMGISMEPVDLTHTISGAVELVAPMAAERSVQLSIAQSDNPGRHVRADRQRLNQILLNLLSNAIKYNRNGGAVTVSVEDPREGRVRILVSDTGEGIAQEDIEKLFIPFERLDAENGSVEGTGLGLPLSKRLAEEMNGTLTVDSEQGAGTTFCLELGLDRAPSARPEPEDVARPVHVQRKPGTLTVLYIEDNLSNLKLVEQLLSHRPEVELLSAMTGTLGLEFARQHEPDLILLDLHLPGMPGSEVLRHLRDDPRTRDVPVAVLTADATPGQAERLRKAGASVYLSKPLDVKELLTLVDQTARQSGVTNGNGGKP
jgi:PAS domain S-box-containing protein